MRTFLAICLMSAVVHIALLMAVAVPYQRQTAHGETMSVELVPSNEAPPAGDGLGASEQPQQQDAKSNAAETVPDFSRLRLSDTPKMPQDEQKQATAPPPEQQQQSRQQQAQKSQGQGASQQPSPQSASQQQPAPQQQQATLPQLAPGAPQESPELPKIAPEMAVETPADQYQRLAALMNIPSAILGPNDSYGSEAETKAKLANDDVSKFKAHLKTCWKLPPGVPEDTKVKILIRIALLPNGALAAQPELIGGPSAVSPASEFVLPVYKNAVAALKQCAPYNMLPAEKYKEWRVLDINVSPDEMARG